MAAPTYVATGTASGGSGNLTPGLPSGWAQNDIFLMTVYSEQLTVTAPAGWAHVTNSPAVNANTTFNQTSVLWKRAGASESAPTVTDPGGTWAMASISAYRDCAGSGNPWDVTGTDTNDAFGSSISASGVTTTVADCLVVVCVASDSGIGAISYSSWANSSLTSVTERTDTASGTYYAIGVVTGVKATAGATGSTTATSANQGYHSAITVALKPNTGVSGDMAATLPSVTSSFSGYHRIDADVSVTLPSMTSSLSGIASPPDGPISVTLPSLTSTFDGAGQPGGFLTSQLPSVTSNFPGGVNPSGSIDCTLPSLVSDFGSETVPFGEHVIHVEAEKRGLQVIQDDPGIIPIYALSVFASDVGIGNAGHVEVFVTANDLEFSNYHVGECSPTATALNAAAQIGPPAGTATASVVG